MEAHTTHAQLNDASEQATLQPWVEMECHQLSRGPRVGAMNIVDIGGSKIVRETQAASVQKLGYFPEGLCTISCCRLADNATPDHFNDVQAGGEQDALFFLSGGTEYDIFVPQGAESDYVLFDLDAFLASARALDPAGWERAPEHVVALPNTSPRKLFSLVNRWLRVSSLDDRTALSRLLMHQVVSMVSAPQLDTSSTFDRPRAFSICQQARAMVDAQLMHDELPSMVELCTALSVSRRTLEYAFRTYVDMSPLAYLRRCRLNRARAVLREADASVESVTAVALRFGFLHLGRFARDYKSLFDESPSQTLSRT